MPNDIDQSVRHGTDDSPVTGEKKLKRVCLYIVAEDKDMRRTEEFMDQQLTLIHLINNTPGWKYEKIYMDILREHTQFDEMIADCEAGKYDIIVTKSILLFDKTVYHTLKLARHLAELNPPVEIIFTDQAIFSLDSDRLKDLEEMILGTADEDELTRKKSAAMNKSYFIRAWNGMMSGEEEGE